MMGPSPPGKRANWRQKTRLFDPGWRPSLEFDPGPGPDALICSNRTNRSPPNSLLAAAWGCKPLALACPITRGGAVSRGKAWTVPLPGLGLATDGVVLCNQLKTLDWQVRRAAFIDAVPAERMADVLARVAVLSE